MMNVSTAPASGRWVRHGSRIVLLPGGDGGMQGEVSGPLSPNAAIHPNIDVHAQYALVRMSKADAPARAAALGLLNAVKSHRLGIYKVDQQVPAMRAKKLGGWWNVIPKGQDAAVFLDPAQPFTSMPLIVFRDAVKNAPALLDPALRAAWETYQALGSCQVPGGASQAELTPGIVPANLVPGLLCQVSAGSPTGGAPGTQFSIQCTGFKVTTINQYISQSVGDALDGLVDKFDPDMAPWLDKAVSAAAGFLREWLLKWLEHQSFGAHRLLPMLIGVLRKLPIEIIRDTATFKIVPGGGGTPLTLCYDGEGVRVVVPGGELLVNMLEEVGLRLSPKEKDRLKKILPTAIRKLLTPLESADAGPAKHFATSKALAAGHFSGSAFVTRTIFPSEIVRLGFRAPAFITEYPLAKLTRTPCTDCWDIVVPVPVKPKGRDFVALTYGSLKAENCAQATNALSRPGSPRLALPRGR